MNDNKLQLLIYGEDLHQVEIHLHHHHGVHLKNMIRGEAKEYLIINLEIARSLQGEHEFTLEFKSGSDLQLITYKLKARNDKNPQGLDQSDFIFQPPSKFLNYSDQFIDKVVSLGMTAIVFDRPIDNKDPLRGTYSEHYPFKIHDEGNEDYFLFIYNCRGKGLKTISERIWRYFLGSLEFIFLKRVIKFIHISSKI